MRNQWCCLRMTVVCACRWYDTRTMFSVSKTHDHLPVTLTHRRKRGVKRVSPDGCGDCPREFARKKTQSECYPYLGTAHAWQLSVPMAVDRRGSLSKYPAKIIVNSVSLIRALTVHPYCPCWGETDSLLWGRGCAGAATQQQLNGGGLSWQSGNENIPHITKFLSTGAVLWFFSELPKSSD